MDYKYKLQLSDRKAEIEVLNSDYRKLTELYAEKCKKDETFKTVKSFDGEELERKNQKLSLENERLFSQI